MILVTVGTQLPFDRLIRIIDDAAPTLGQPVFAQTGPGSYAPQNIDWKAMVEPVVFAEMLERATLIVAHAGVGSVLMAQQYRKPIIVFPRHASLGEHRNEHQLATIVALENRPGIYVARTKEVLIDLLGQRLDAPDDSIVRPDRALMINRIQEFIAGANGGVGSKSRNGDESHGP
jgi:UDP-N-acetylglucosamine transferase subunit ALG13